MTWLAERRRPGVAVLAAVLALASGQALAAEACALCSTAIITNSGLASCFLEKFSDLSRKGGAAVAVNLSDCSADRGIVDALPTLGANPAPEPDTEFLLTRAQLDCLKAKLEEPGLVLDPQARIDLGTCG